MAETTFDVIIVGGGPGGYVAAIRGAQLGMKMALVEAEHLGGICLNWGCIPTKALLCSAEILHYAQHAKDYGLKIAGEIEADLDAVVKRSRGVAKQLNQGVTHLMKKNKIAVHMGEGTLTGPTSLTVKGDKGEEKLTAKHIIVATGARARDLPFAKADRIVPVEDRDVSAFPEKSLTKQGMTIMTGAGVEDLKVSDKGVKAKIKDSKGKVTETEFSHCITAIGIVPNTEDIGLDKLADMEKGFIQIDGYGRTKSKGLWAIGDCTPGPWLAHKASHEGVTTAEAIAKELGNKDVHPHPLDRNNIPGCTYCHPQIASVGLTEAKAKEAGHEVKAGTFPFIGNGKAIALGEAEGFVKTVFDAKTGELLGAHMVGAEVTEMIQGFVVGKTLETTEAELMQTVFPHPTISESMHESVLASYGRALHI